MSLTDYTGLKAEIADWSNKTNLTDQIPSFIAAAEAEANSKLRVRQMLCRATASLTDEYTPLPASYCGVRSVDLLTNPVTPMESRDPDDIRQMKATSASSGTPRFYAIVGDDLQVYPAPDSTYTVEFLGYESLDPLASNSTNWLLTRYPHAYLHGALKYASLYLKDDTETAKHTRLFDKALQDIQAADIQESHGARPAMRTRGFG